MAHYIPPSELNQAKNMLSQLEYAVKHCNGKTILTETDINLISFLIRNLESYDRKAFRG